MPNGMGQEGFLLGHRVGLLIVSVAMAGLVSNLCVVGTLRSVSPCCGSW